MKWQLKHIKWSHKTTLKQCFASLSLNAEFKKLINILNCCFGYLNHQMQAGVHINAAILDQIKSGPFVPNEMFAARNIKLKL